MSPLLVLTALLASQEAPAAREVLGICHGVDGPVAVQVTRAPTLQKDRRRWDLGLTALNGRGVVARVDAQVDAPLAMPFIPAAPAMSWRELDDGTQLIWTERLTAALGPLEQDRPGLMTRLSVERGGAACEGAAWLVNVPRASAGTTWGVLLVPHEAVALAGSDEGRLSTLPLVAAPPPRDARRRRRGRAREPSVLAGDTAIRFERTDVRLDPETGTPVAGAWRVALVPSRSAGRLQSEVAVVLQRGGQKIALHRVTGVLQLDGGGGAVDGVLVEVLPPG